MIQTKKTNYTVISENSQLDWTFDDLTLIYLHMCELCGKKIRKSVNICLTVRKGVYC